MGLEAGPASEDHLESKLEDICHILGLLERLSPTLRYPPPMNLFDAGGHDGEIETDIHLARRIFPKASDSLASRLGKANWQRRLFLRSLRARLRREKSSAYQMAITPGGGRQSRLISPQDLPTGQIQFLPKLPPHYRSVLSRLNSRRTSTSDSTANTSAFWSKPESLTAETANSVAESDDHGKPNQLTVPAPPVALEKGATFRCQYCCLDIEVGETCAELRRRWLYQTKATGADAGEPPLISEENLGLPTSLEVLTSADWVAHVIADIEPYICTAEPCYHATKTYGSIADWLKHELYVHRLARIWTCQLCHENFGLSGAFEAHLIAAHQVHPEQALTLSDFCKRFTDDPPDLDCALCALKCTSIDSFRIHVGGHLEQLALCSIEADEKVDEDVPASPIHQPASADYARLEEFVCSQSQYYSPDVFREASGRNVFSQRSKDDVGKSTRIDESKRPSMPGRGPSYSFLSNARKQKAKEMGAEKTPHTPPVGAFSTISKTVRTNPPPRNVDFIGRIGDMDNVHRELSRPGNVCVLSGIGGLGKSALAAEYTYRFAVTFSYIFWVQAETPMICADTFAQIAIMTAAQKGISLPSFDEQRLVGLSQEFLEQTNDRWLLVFDNVDQKLDLRRFLPADMARTAGSVLITTNRADFGLANSPFTFTQVNLGALTLEESRRLLLSATPRPHHHDAKPHPEYKLAGEIAKRAERLPLALSLIAGYVMVSHCTLADFVDLWNERRKNIRTSSQPSKGHVSETDEAMETLWDIGLREVTSDARKLLNILAFLDPDHIQKDLLVGPHEDPIVEMLHVSEASR
jgi:NB-ARC domain